MAGLPKLDWFATWQNCLAFLLAVAAVVWLGEDMSAAETSAIFVVAFAVVRLLTMALQALWKRFAPRPK